MDIGRAVQYVFQDPNWIMKVLIGGLLFLIPIIGWAIIAGYYIRSLRLIVQGADTPLPEWNDWGGDLARGFKLFIIWIVWYAPVWVISLCVLVPITAIMDSDVVGLLLLPVQCLLFVLSIAIVFLAPLIFSKYAMTEQIGDGLKFGEIFAEAQRFPKELLIVLFINMVVGFAAQFGVILCGIGVLFTFFIAYLVNAHLAAQVRRTVDGGMAPPPPPPPAGSPAY